MDGIRCLTVLRDIPEDITFTLRLICRSTPTIGPPPQNTHAPRPSQHRATSACFQDPNMQNHNGNLTIPSMQPKTDRRFVSNQFEPATESV